jgi:hypothetical protein
MAIDAKTTLAAALAVLALAAPAYAAEITQQPQSVERAEVVEVAWTGEASNVVVERRHGLFWLADPSEVLLEQEHDGTWYARWQPTYFTPVGSYRIQVDDVTSEVFHVLPCSCVIPNQVKARWRKGRFRLTLTAEYAPAPPGSFHALPKRVTTGRPVVRVFHEGRRVGSVRLRYRRGKFRGSWAGHRKPPSSTVFEVVSLTDAFKNR